MRKVRTLLAHHANITVVAPEPSAPVKRLARKGRITLRQRRYRMADLKRMRLVFVATDDAKLNRRIADEARRRHILVNVVDHPNLCDFIVPSVVRRGRLLVAISTEGACPAYSKRLRTALEKQFDRAYGDYVELLARLRHEILSMDVRPREGVRFLERLLDENLLAVIRRKGRRAAEGRARTLLAAWLGGKLRPV